MAERGTVRDESAARSADARWSATVTGDPLQGMPIGAKIEIHPWTLSSSDATAEPQSVINWEAMSGAVLSLGIRDSAESQMLGSAVMIGFALAVTARHILDPYMDRVMAGKATPFLFGIREGHVDMWKVREVSYDTTDDTSYLSLELMTAIPDNWVHRVMPVTTRTPTVGEPVTITGFRFNEPVPNEPLIAERGFEGQLLAATGQVVEVFPDGRDPVMVPFPAFQIECGSIPSMSGGAVIDELGHLLGITSTGFKIDGETGFTTASWIAPTLTRLTKVPWPPGAYPEPLMILKAATFVERREAFSFPSDGQALLSYWTYQELNRPVIPPTRER